MKQVLATVFVAMVMTWYPITTQDLEPINEHGLNPGAAHVCVTTTKEAYVITESFQQYYRYKSNTWCVAFPPRCTVYFIRSRTAYRKVTKYRDRKTYVCCKGYKPQTGLSYCVPSCVDDCHDKTYQGYCILPDECLCREGFKGELCESGCAANEWGRNCEKVCNCAAHGSCDPETGQCVCHIGYTGSDCSQPCVDSFGLHCVNPCVCENNSTCNNVNGRCTCHPGYFGEYCHKTCDPSTVQEEGCQQTCACQNGGVCDKQTEKCICASGYKGEYCAEVCDGFHYGQNCTQLCACYNQGICDPTNGKCQCDIGYTGESCEIQCSPGKYGNQCSQSCPCQNGGVCEYNGQREIICNCTDTGFTGPACTQRVCPFDHYLSIKTGQCVPCSCPWQTTQSCNALSTLCQCKPGYQGDDCSIKCDDPFYGKNCAQVCPCAETGKCHHVTGECVECYPGYTGDNCTQTCPPNKYGLNCANHCSCLNGANCHASTGYCECKPGYRGTVCNEPCPHGKYGRNCEQDCLCDLKRSICSPYDGSCQCKPGYQGLNCVDECEEGQYGFLCIHNCSCSVEGTKGCDPMTGECRCKPGWHGVTCNSPCLQDSWGSNCVNPCDCSGRGSCDHLNGACICEAGYHGETCENECMNGTYGYKCMYSCPVCSPGFNCDPATGECVTESCPPGLMGLKCNKNCPQGRWGLKCSNTCSVSCIQNGFCNPVTGMCVCYPGYFGAQCDQECPKGKFGFGCANDCPCIESRTETCHHVTGRCHCLSGYTGNYCEKVCDLGYWGPNCRLSCSKAGCVESNSIGCDAINGLPCTCIDQYTGTFCSDTLGQGGTSGGQTGTNNTSAAAASISPIIVGVVVGVLLLLILAVVVLYFSRRVRKLKNENLRVQYSVSNGTLPGQTNLGNGTIGVVNPTYQEQNMQNEHRYPHLAQRASSLRPPLPERQQSCEPFDDIDEEKMRVTMARGDKCDSRPTSGTYSEPEEDRYTTLKSVMGNATLERSSSTQGADKDYTLYQGQRSEEEGQNSPSRSPSRSSNDGHAGYVNNAYGYSEPKKHRKHRKH
ncbi:multiple epidermal growth factor-like domains protein 10 isoform X2 [Mya arenaria]|uniref:multiple epidermal growth factor-like domains protein 10 isoform X2 n=1 Tax=Mya arenaria TaxID=6604 RepID=UPI0022DFB7CB|nr:multiple epidermal growth factor-like domains protein 10 isoform X2 [Mya arenaria]XP_052786695.1 multiple epidermal growth factor-like domains protein 10 isoform X2 [Mya arenaria]